MNDAARRGLEYVEDFWDLTPREIACRISSWEGKRRMADLMAWMGARYIALSVHAPEKLPPRPVFFGDDEEEMSPEDMKAAMKSVLGNGEK